MLCTIIVILFLACGLIFILPWLILWSLATGNPDLMYACAMKAIRIAMWLAGIRVRVEGLENIPPGACVFASNHVSNVDPLVFVLAIPRRVSLLAKKEVFRIPILATAMRCAKFVPVDRGSKDAAAASVDVAASRLKEGLSFAIFAEGTRSPTGRLGPFKKGAFVMAILARVPVVPVSIAGTQTLMRKGDWTLHSGEVTVRFGPAVDAARYTMDRRAELLAQVEQLVAAGLPPDQQPPATNP